MVAKSKDKRVQTVLGYGSNPPFRSVFDFSYMVTVIEFLEDPVSTLTAINKAGKHGSSLLCFL